MGKGENGAVNDSALFKLVPVSVEEASKLNDEEIISYKYIKVSN